MTIDDTDKAKNALRVYREKLNEYLPSEVRVESMPSGDIWVNVSGGVAMACCFDLDDYIVIFKPHVSEYAKGKLVDMIKRAYDGIIDDWKHEQMEQTSALDAILAKITKEPTA